MDAAISYMKAQNFGLPMKLFKSMAGNAPSVHGKLSLLPIDVEVKPVIRPRK